MDIVFANSDLIVVNKPAGLVCHAYEDDFKENVLDLVAKDYPEVKTNFPGVLEGGLCHRLDNDTSGLLVIAKTPEAKQTIRSYFQSNESRKVYLALVSGRLEKRILIQTPIAHHPKSKKRMVVVGEGERHRGEPKPACTEVLPFKIGSKETLCRVILKGPGRRHQIRVHLASACHSLVGDHLYGTEDSRFVGQALCAIELDLPEVGRVLLPDPGFDLQ